MEKADLEKFKRKLLQIKTQILNTGLANSMDDVQISTDDLADEADLATNVISQQISFQIKERELEKLRRIEAALDRINEATYGLCLDCDEEIGMKRLDNHPWTEYCIIHAEEREREQMKFYSSRASS